MIDPINTMVKSWEALAGKTADKEGPSDLIPSIMFWIGGILIFIIHYGWANLEKSLLQLPPLIAGITLVWFLIVIVLSSIIVRPLIDGLSRILQGYWPKWLSWLSFWSIRIQFMRFKKARVRLEELIFKETKGALSPDEYSQRIALDKYLRRVPASPSDYMPTMLGNILHAAENRPFEKYGLLTFICWPRLWLLLPDNVKNELVKARANLDFAILIYFWSILFLVWTVWAWWVPLVTLVSALWTYRWALSAAELYGNLQEAAFDLHRFALYEALHWPLPSNTSEEERKGIQLTGYLFRGLVAEPVEYQKPEKSQKPDETNKPE